MLHEAQLKDLLDKALAGKASEAELRILTDALNNDEGYEVTEQIAAFLGRQPVGYTLPDQQRVAQLADQILAADKLTAVTALPAAARTPVMALWKKLSIAAAVIAVVTSISFYLMRQNTRQPDAPVTNTETTPSGDINPGYNKARLILADGSIVDLDSVAKGLLSLQGHTRISKNQDGQVAYAVTETAPKENNGVAPLYNTIEVPRGGQYQLILSDGTQVWLNAASSLRFPVSFTGSERVVELNGEGYFEVSSLPAFPPVRDKLPGGGGEKKPFIVRTKDADVQVVGTHFNVCAYAGEDWKTTLLEGKVIVKHNSTQTTLMPGNQAVFAVHAERVSMVPDANINEAIAWKEGYFQFNDAGIPAIMQQLSRWYDVDIIYKDAVSRANFNGRIKRTTKLSGIVNALKEGGINCTVDGNRLMVYP